MSDDILRSDEEILRITQENQIKASESLDYYNRYSEFAHSLVFRPEEIEVKLVRIPIRIHASHWPKHMIALRNGRLVPAQFSLKHPTLVELPVADCGPDLESFDEDPANEFQ